MLTIFVTFNINNVFKVVEKSRFSKEYTHDTYPIVGKVCPNYYTRKSRIAYRL